MTNLDNWEDAGSFLFVSNIYYGAGESDQKEEEEEERGGGTYEPVLVEHLNGGEHLGDIKTETELVVRGNPPLLDLFLAAQQGLGNDCGGIWKKKKKEKWSEGGVSIYEHSSRSQCSQPACSHGGEGGGSTSSKASRVDLVFLMDRMEPVQLGTLDSIPLIFLSIFFFSLSDRQQIPAGVRGQFGLSISLLLAKVPEAAVSSAMDGKRKKEAFELSKLQKIFLKIFLKRSWRPLMAAR